MHKRICRPLAGGFAALAAVALAGCGPKNGGATEIPAAPDVKLSAAEMADFFKADGTGKPGGRFTDATIADPKTFNLIIANETSSTAPLGPVFDALLIRNPETLKFEPALADSWTESSDHLKWTFKLRKGVRWSDGQPFTADDVTFSYDLIYDKNIPSPARDILTFDGKPLSYKKIDDLTVEFALPEVVGPFLDVIGIVPILPKHKLEQAWKDNKFSTTWALDTPPTELVGTGPFVMVKYTPAQSMVYRRNPYYWRVSSDGQQLPFLQGGVTQIVPDLNTVVLRFKSKETDYTGLRPQDWPEMQNGASAGDYKTYDAGPTWGFSYLAFNLNPANAKMPAYKRAWFNKKEFRQAVSYAIDRDNMVKTALRGIGRPLYTPVSAANKVFFNDKIKPPTHDTAKAAALLASAGFVMKGADLYDAAGNKVEFTLLTNTGNNINLAYCTAIQEDLRKVGIAVTVSPVEFNSLVEKMRKTFDWEANVLGFTGGVEPLNGKNVWLSSGQTHPWWPQEPKPATPWEAEIDQIFSAAGKEPDEQKRKLLYDRWQEIVNEQQPLIFLATVDSLSAARNRLSNVRPTSLQGIRWNIYEFSER